jgi:hypothetical protein
LEERTAREKKNAGRLLLGFPLPARERYVSVPSSQLVFQAGHTSVRARRSAYSDRAARFAGDLYQQCDLSVTALALWQTFRLSLMAASCRWLVSMFCLG